VLSGLLFCLIVSQSAPQRAQALSNEQLVQVYDILLARQQMLAKLQPERDLLINGKAPKRALDLPSKINELSRLIDEIDRSVYQTKEWKKIGDKAERWADIEARVNSDLLYGLRNFDSNESAPFIFNVSSIQSLYLAQLIETDSEGGQKILVNTGYPLLGPKAPLKKYLKDLASKKIKLLSALQQDLIGQIGLRQTYQENFVLLSELNKKLSNIAWRKKKDIGFTALSLALFLFHRKLITSKRPPKFCRSLLSKITSSKPVSVWRNFKSLHPKLSFLSFPGIPMAIAGYWGAKMGTAYIDRRNNSQILRVTPHEKNLFELEQMHPAISKNLDVRIELMENSNEALQKRIIEILRKDKTGINSTIKRWGSLKEAQEATERNLKAIKTELQRRFIPIDN